MDLSPKQIKSLYEATKRFNIWVGAVRSGKTYSSILAFRDFLKNGPKGDAMIVGVNRATIQRNVLNELFRFLGATPPNSKSTETVLYGRNVYFVGAHDEGAVRAIQGSTLATAYVDEITCIPEPFFKMLSSRLSIPKAQLFGTCNPDSPAHWLKKNYIDRAKELDVGYWQFVLDDNPSLDEFYKENLKKEYLGSHWYNRFILGEWVAAVGSVYDSFDHDNVHEAETYFQPASFYIAGIDYGTVNATCCVLAAVTPNQFPQIRVEDEYYYDSQKIGRLKSDAELAKDIFNFLALKKVRSVYVDPAAASLKVELTNLGLPVKDAKNDVIPGIQIVSKFIGGKNLTISRKCKNLIEQIQSYRWDPKSLIDGKERPIKEQDHAVDALRYACASAFPRGKFDPIDSNLTIDQIRRQINGAENPYEQLAEMGFGQNISPY